MKIDQCDNDQLGDGPILHADRFDKIFINGRFLTQKITGVQRYAVEVLKELDSIIGSLRNISVLPKVEILAPKGAIANQNLNEILLRQVGYCPGHIWEQLELPWHAKDGLLLSLCNTGPILKRQHIVTIHDASVYGFPSAYSFVFRNWYKLLFTGLGRTARKIITDSKFSKNELQRYCRIAPNKIKTIFLGGEHLDRVISDVRILQAHGLVKDNYVLAVSSLNPNKNFQSIVEAVKILGETRFNFVIAGSRNPRIFGQGDLSLPPNVTHVGYVSDEELKALYENAACFVYPSFYEGFGLPPLEAMASGCPVLVSAAASLPEVCGDAAVYCNPHDPADIAGKVRMVMADAELRGKMRNEGIARAKTFSWEKCAREFWSEIEKVFKQ